MECIICTEKFNSVKRKVVQCPYCSNTACRECVKTYILSIVGDPTCLNCKANWNHDFVYNSMTKVFIDKE